MEFDIPVRPAAAAVVVVGIPCYTRNVLNYNELVVPSCSNRRGGSSHKQPNGLRREGIEGGLVG